MELKVAFKSTGVHAREAEGLGNAGGCLEGVI